MAAQQAYEIFVVTGHGYVSVSYQRGFWYTRIEYDNGKLVEFYTKEQIIKAGRF